jgi:hypothetical protein
MKIAHLDFFIIHTTTIDLEITSVLSHYYVTVSLCWDIDRYRKKSNLIKRELVNWYQTRQMYNNLAKCILEESRDEYFNQALFIESYVHVVVWDLNSQCDQSAVTNNCSTWIIQLMISIFEFHFTFIFVSFSNKCFRNVTLFEALSTVIVISLRLNL